MMPPFRSINNVNTNNSNLVVEELNIRDVNDKEFNAVKHTIAALIKPLDSVPKE